MNKERGVLLVLLGELVQEEGLSRVAEGKR